MVDVSVVVNSTRWWALELAHRAALERDAMTVVHESVEDGVGERRLVDVCVPLIDGKLAGDERGLLVVAILEDLKQVSLGLIGERRESEVVDVQQIDFGELLQER